LLGLVLGAGAARHEQQTRTSGSLYAASGYSAVHLHPSIFGGATYSVPRASIAKKSDSRNRDYSASGLGLRSF